MIKAIIFDFDGVIAESINIKTNAFAELYGSYGKAVVDKVIKHHQLNGGISRFEKFKYYHKEFLGVDLSKKNINELAEQFSELVIDKIIHAPFIPGAEEYIKKNYNKYLLFISSGTPKKELVEICKQRGIIPYFKIIYGSPEEKSYHIKEILIKWHLKARETVFIGDAVSDREAAIQNQLHFIAKVDVDNDSPLINEMLQITDLSALQDCIDRIVL